MKISKFQLYVINSQVLNASNGIDWVIVKMSTLDNYGETIYKLVLVII